MGRTILADRLVMTPEERAAYQAWMHRHPFQGGAAQQRAFIAGFRAAGEAASAETHEVDPWSAA